MTRLWSVPPAEPCALPHEPGPADPIAWTAWALDRQATHTVERCPDCGRYVLWFRRAKPVPDTGNRVEYLAYDRRPDGTFAPLVDGEVVRVERYVQLEGPPLPFPPIGPLNPNTTPETETP